MIRICIILLFGFAHPIVSQDVHVLLDRAQSYHMRNYDSCIHYSDLVIEQGISPHHDTLVVHALFLKGWNLYLQGQFVEAILIFRTLTQHSGSSESQLEYIRGVGRIGTAFREIASFDSSLFYLLKYDQLVDTHLGDHVIEAKLELGELYLMMGRMVVSNEYKIEAIRRARTSDNRMDKIMSLYYLLEDNADDIGKPQYQEYLDEYLSLIGKTRLDGSVDYAHSGALLLHFSGEDKLAILEADVERIDMNARGKGYIILNQHLVREYLALKNYSAAEMQTLAGLETAETRNEVGFVLEYLKLLTEIFEEADEYEKAYEYINAFYILKDSLFTITTMANVDSLKIQFETVKKEQELIDQQLKLERRTHQRNLLIAGFAALIWFGTFVILYLVNRNKINKKLALQDIEIQEQHIQQLEKEKQILAMNSMIEGQEAERMRIARDLHDGLGGLLGTVKAHFSVIQEEIKKLEGINLYDEVDQLIDTASAEVRRISHNMAPHALRFGGLHDALLDLSNQLRSKTLQVSYEWTGTEDRMEESIEVMLYRIVQELTHNTVKYAKANNLMIQVNRYEEQLNLIIEDDGDGFIVDEALIKGGLGLRSVRSRIDYIEGTLDIDSSPGEGTTISIQMNIK